MEVAAIEILNEKVRSFQYQLAFEGRQCIKNFASKAYFWYQIFLLELCWDINSKFQRQSSHVTFIYSWHNFYATAQTEFILGVFYWIEDKRKRDILHVE